MSEFLNIKLDDVTSVSLFMELKANLCGAVFCNFIYCEMYCILFLKT